MTGVFFIPEGMKLVDHYDFDSKVLKVVREMGNEKAFSGFKVVITTFMGKSELYVEEEFFAKFLELLNRRGLTMTIQNGKVS